MTKPAIPAGTSGRQTSPCTSLGRFLCGGAQVHPLQVAVREVARDLFPTEHREPEFELHGANIFGGSGWFEGWSPAERIDAYRRLVALVGAHDARVIVRGVNKPRLADRYEAPCPPTRHQLDVHA